MMNEDSAASDKVRVILMYFFEGRISISDFCAEFETQYNLNTDFAALPARDRSIYDDLLQVTSWYSPFPDERRQIPNYVDEEAVETAARVAAERLGLFGSGTTVPAH